MGKHSKKPKRFTLSRRKKNPELSPECPYKLEPREIPFPPGKHQINLDEFLGITEAAGNKHNESNWFEDANCLYCLDYTENGSHITYAMGKDLYVSNPTGKKLNVFDYTQCSFDARFIFGENINGTLKFGIYRDNNLGRILYLTEPKMASHVLLSVIDHEGEFEWIDKEADKSGIDYFRRNPFTHTVYAVFPIGTRFDKVKQLAIVHYGDKIKDSELCQRLFEERLEDFAGIPVKFTEFKIEEPPLDPEQLAEKAQREKEEAERLDRLNQNLEKTRELLARELAKPLTEFGLDLSLNRDLESLKTGPHEIVTLTLTKDDASKQVVFTFSVDGEAFLVSFPETNTSYIAAETKLFLEKHREAFEAYKRIYAANKSYHDLINPNSRKPVLNYPHIFETESLFTYRKKEHKNGE